MDNNQIKKQRLLENFYDDMGPLLPYLEDLTLTDIYVNQTGEIVTESFKTGKVFTNVFISEEQMMAIIISAAELIGWKLNPNVAVPKVEGTLPLPKPNNFRFTGLLPPASYPPSIAMRRPALKVFTLEEYVERKQLSKYDYALICDTIKNRGNILVGGQTGSGKTTFTNACIHKMVEYTPYDRFYIVEDTQELVCEARDKVMLIATNPENAAAELVQESLRFTPNRIIFGELRYPQVVFDYVTALNTGHSGNITTIHANTAMSMIPRLTNLYTSKTGNSITPDFTDIISLCVHLARTSSGPIVDEVLPMNHKVYSFIDEIKENGLA